MTVQKEFDVIVVGGGGSGLAAAVTAAEKYSTLLLERMPFLGGSTGIAVGSFTANQTQFQKKRGIEDNPDDHEQDAAKFGPPEYQERNNTQLRRFFLAQTNQTLEWLKSLGLSFHGPSPEPPNRVPRMHNVVPNAKAYIAVLQSCFLRKGGTIECNAEVTGLTFESGCCVGVKATINGTPQTLRARRGVILAAGDYAGSPEMIAQYKGAQFAAIEGINPYARGDGHRLAQAAGAPLLNMDITYGPELRFVPPPRKPFSQLLPAGGICGWAMGVALPFVPEWFIKILVKRLLVTWQHPENALFDDGAILINSNGERFCNETATPERETLIAEQAGKISYILLDRPLIEKYSQWPHFISTAPEIAYAYVKDYLRLRKDVAVSGKTIEEIARKRKIPLEALKKTVQDWQERGIGSDKESGGGEAIDQWVLLGPIKSYFTTTEGGPAINEKCQLLDKQGTPIPGVYAAGQNGLGGMVLWGHGLHIAWAITSGRIAGRLES